MPGDLLELRRITPADWRSVGVEGHAGFALLQGLDITRMLDYARQHKTIEGFPGGDPIENEQLFTLDELVAADSDSVEVGAGKSASD